MQARFGEGQSEKERLMIPLNGLSRSKEYRNLAGCLLYFQHDNRSVEYKVTGWKLGPDGRHITFTDGCGIGRLRLVGNKKQRIETFPEKQIKRVRIVRRADGYFVQFCVESKRHIVHAPTDRQVGIDVGLKVFYADSDGNMIENPRHYRQAEKKLKRLHRQLSRKKKGSA